jgi:hypothetical protein
MPSPISDQSADFDSLARDLPPDGVTELEDGSALVEDPSETVASSTDDFGANLAETLSEFELNTISSSLVELIEADKTAREERDKQQAEGIRRTGLGDDAPGGATFEGASKIVHPVLAEGCVDFSARAIKELFPANGPVKTKIFGKVDEQKLEKSRKKRDFLNWYVTEKMPEYRSEKEILFTQLPLGGSQYEKYWFDGKRVRMEFVPIDKVYLPFSANSFYTASRITHERDLTEAMVDEHIDSGFYRNVFSSSDDVPEETASQSATDKIEGKESGGYNKDGVRAVYEVTCEWDIDKQGRKPYVIHIDEPTGKIAAIYRNWKESDDTYTKLDWWVEDKFIPWRGAYGIGFPHLIGGMAAALTGSLRALLDSAHINNAPSAIKLKGGRASGQNINIDVTGVTEMEAPAGTDDIRKIMMPLPFNPPSQVLFQLLDWITGQAKGVVATAEERIADAGSQMPVGTALALIEQGSQVFSSIHARLHEAQRRALKIICRLIADYSEHALADLGRFDLVPADFLDSDDVEPVSDPNIFSETQRFAQMQGVMQLAGGDVQDPSIPWNKIAIRRRMLDMLRVDNTDELLPKPPVPITADPAQENVAVMQGAQLKASPVQDHLAHIKVHLMFVLHPMIAASQGLGQPLAGLMAHVQEHFILDYQHVYQSALMVAQAQNPGASPDQLALIAAMQTQQATSAHDQQLAPMLQQATQLVQSKNPPPPTDPAVEATFKAAMANIDAKKAADAEANKLAIQKHNDEMAARQREFDAAPMVEQMKREHEAQMEVLRMQREDEQKQFAEMMANQRNDQDNRMSQMTELLKNKDDNDTAVILEAMKQQMASMQESLAQAESGRTQTAEMADTAPIMKQLQETLKHSQEAQKQDDHRAAMTSIMEGLKGVTEHLAKPKMIIKDENGKAIGIGPQS